LEHDLSFDRLGETGTVNRRAVSFLRELAIGQQPSQHPFYGWAQLRVDMLRGIQVKATPIAGEPGNPYHSDVIRDDFRKTSQAEALAYQLWVLSQALGILRS